MRHIAAGRHRLADADGAFRAFSPEVVVDLVLSSGSQARELLRVCRPFARRIVAASSMDVYRAAAVLHGIEAGPIEPVPLTEDSPLRTGARIYPPQQLDALKGVFGWLDDEYDKVAVERRLTADPSIPCTILRLPMIFGPGDRLHRFFPALERMDDGRSAILFDERLAGWRSPRGYVENVAAAVALAAAADAAAGRVYNVADEAVFSEMEWTRLIAAEAGWAGALVALPADRLPPHLRAHGNFAQDWVADSTRIRRELGFREPIPRDEALRRTIAWERANPPPFNPEMFDYAAEDRVNRRKGRW
ncbi:MAG: NAD-dependent dehydratase [Betaproteobacteria bacterium]